MGRWSFVAHLSSSIHSPHVALYSPRNLGESNQGPPILGSPSATP